MVFNITHIVSIIKRAYLLSYLYATLSLLYVLFQYYSNGKNVITFENTYWFLLSFGILYVVGVLADILYQHLTKKY